MALTSFFKNPKTALIGSSFAILGGVLASASATTNPVSMSLLITSGLSALAGLGGNFFSSACEKSFLDKSSRDEILKNGDLTRAVGKAIFLLILQESKKELYGDDRPYLEIIGNSAENVWEDIVLGIEDKENPRFVLSEEDLRGISSDFLTQYVAAETGKIGEIESLTFQEWRMILEKIAEKHDLIIQFGTALKVAQELHKHFALTLRKILITDFSEDGKAYASLQLRILGETLFYVKENHSTNIEILGKVHFLAERVQMISELLTNSQIKPDESFWQKALNLQKSTLETHQEILQVQQKVLENSTQQTEFQKQLVELQSAALRALEKLAEPPSPIAQQCVKLIPSVSFPQPINFFTGRKDVLDEIKETLQRYKYASLFGIHGLGKTSVAIQYAYQSLDDYNQIIFVLANENDFFSSMAECAANVGLPFTGQMEDERKAAVFRHWLTTQSNFLLILDNVDKVEQVKLFLPTPNKGHILFTSNSPSIKNAGKEVEIKKMQPEEAELLLYRRAKEDSEAKYNDISPQNLAVIKKIVTETGFLPLAINIAGSYIARKQKTFEDYWELYQKYSHRLLQEFDKDDPNYLKSVLTVYSLSFDSMIKPKDDSDEEKFIANATANCLKTCAFLLADNIPEEIFRSSTALISESYSEFAADDFLWNEVVENLLAYGFFERNIENSTFSTHRLIPKITRTKIGDQENVILERLVSVFDTFFPDFDYTTKTVCERYLAHLEHLLNFLRQDVAEPAAITKLDSENTASLYYKIGTYFWFMGNYELTQSLFEISCPLAEKVLGEEHSLTVACYDHLGGIYHFRGNHDAAIPYLEKVISINERNAAKYEKTLLEYEVQGKAPDEDFSYYEAQLFRNYGSNLMTSNKLARIYHAAGRIQEAYDLITNVINEQIKFYGGVNSAVIDSFTVLSDILDTAGNYAEVELILLKIADFHKATQNENHPLIHQTNAHLGGIYIRQGKIHAALGLLETAYQGLKNYYGDENERVEGTKNNLEYVRFLISGGKAG